MDLKNLRGLIFDKDGTLIDFHGSWGGFGKTIINDFANGDAQKAQAIAAAWEFDLTQGRYSDTSPAVAGSNRELAELAADVLPGANVDDLELRLAVGAAQAVVQPVTDLPKLLTVFRNAGLKLGVMTNDAEQAARAHMVQMGAGEDFDLIVGSDSGHGAKPSADPLLACARMLGLKPAQIAMVGDSTHDLIAGRAAGMVTIAVLTGTALRDELSPYADVVCDSIVDLPAVMGLLASD